MMDALLLKGTGMRRGSAIAAFALMRGLMAPEQSEAQSSPLHLPKFG